MAGRALRKYLIWAIYLALALLVFKLWVGQAIDHNQRKPMLCFHTMVTGQADRPYVRRQLIPLTIKGINYVLPRQWRQSLTQMAQHDPRIADIFKRNPIEPQYFSEYAIGAILVFACLVGFAFAIRLLFLELYSGSMLAADLVPIFALLWLPVTFREANLAYIYDFPALLLFTLSLYSISSQNWSLFYVLFPLGCLNKETFIFITLLFGWYYLRQMLRARLLQHLAAQTALFVLIQGILYWIFRHNPGSQLEFHLLGHNKWFLLHHLLPQDIIWVVALLVLVGAVFHDWQHKPRLLKCGLGMLAFVLSLVAVFAWIDELRAYYEFFPVVMLLLFHTFGKYALGESLCPRKPTASTAGVVHRQRS